MSQPCDLQQREREDRRQCAGFILGTARVVNSQRFFKSVAVAHQNRITLIQPILLPSPLVALATEWIELEPSATSLQTCRVTNLAMAGQPTADDLRS